ncbi:dedicator of cytokinesis family [Trichomonas vaginalis G3]|nr:dedicator of cytokinesis family [Trichomonas vaginalis G3]KAI5516850.1 dedicator of cytokinesis family [Trichomonas vaginalis G3]
MWKTTHGVAVIHHTYIASGPKQMSVLAGDPIEIFEETNDWFLGTNLNTQRSGIFPKVCANFRKLPAINNKQYLAMPEDLLIYDSYLTLNVALQQYATLPASYVLQVFDSIQEIVQIYQSFEDKNQEQFIEFGHTSLGLKIKNIRDALGLPDTFRCGNYSPQTISSWGLDHYLSRCAFIPSHKPKPTEHVMIAAHVNIKNLVQPQQFRFALYSGHINYSPWASQQFSTILTPERPEVDLQFIQLDEYIFNSPLYVVIFIDNIKAATKDQPEQRIPRACASAQLKFRSNPYEKSITSQCTAYAYGNDYHPNLHTAIAISPHNLIHDSIAFSLDCTAFNGEYDMIQSNSAKNTFTVMPYKLPSIVSFNFNRSSLTFRFVNIEQDASRNSFMYIVRMLDASTNKFLPILPKKIQVDPKSAYTETEWHSLVIKGQKELTLDEVVTTDISNYTSKLDNLYLCIEFQRTGHIGKSLSAFGQSVIKLTDQNGAVKILGDGNYQIFPLSYKGSAQEIKDFNLDTAKAGKPIGTLTINSIINSVNFAPNKDINALLYCRPGTPIIPNLQALQTLKAGVWILFSKKIFEQICTLIVGNTEETQYALDSFFRLCYQVYGDIKADNYQSVLFEYINTELTQEKADASNYKAAYNQILAETTKLTAPDRKSDPTYNQTFLALPFIVGFCISLFDSAKGGSKPLFANKIGPIIKRISQFITDKDVPNQLINKLISNIHVIMEFLTKVYNYQQVATIFLEIYNSMGELKSDSPQEILDLKINLINGLASSTMWNEASAMSVLRPVFKTDINLIANDPKMEQKIIDALATIYFTSRNPYPLDFFDIISNYCEKTNKMEVQFFILSLIYQFPKNIPIESAMKSLSSPVIEPKLRLFLTIFFLQENKSRLNVLMKSQAKDPEAMMDIFKVCLESAYLAATPAGIPLDLQIQQKTYGFGANFSVLSDLLTELPSSQIASDALFGHIFHAYSYYQSESLRKMFFTIIDAMFQEKLKNPQLITMILPVLKQYSNLPHFSNISKIFTPYKNEHKQLGELCISALSTIKSTRLQQTKPNQYLLIESYLKLVELGKSLGSKEIIIQNLAQVAQLNEFYKSKIEQAFTLLQILDEIPISNDEKISIPGFEPKNGRLLWIEILRKVLNLFAEESLDEYGIDVLKTFREKVVNKFRHYELLPELYTLESQIYKNMLSGQRNYSKYYRVSFGGVSKVEEAGKTYIYRRPSTVPYAEFLTEMKTLFPDAVVIDRACNIQANAGKERLFISIDMVFPVTEEVEKDVLYHPDTNKPEFLLKWEESKNPYIFKAELQKVNDKDFTQEFHHTATTFPSPCSRCIISENIRKKVSPLEAICLQVIKETSKLNADENSGTSMKDINLDLLHLNGSIGALGKRGIIEAANQYLSANYMEQNPTQKKLCDEFKNLVKNLLGVINRRIEDLKQAADITNATFAKAFEAAKTSYDELYGKLADFLK